MGVGDPIIVRPARNLLLFRYRKAAAWAQTALLAWFLICWYAPVVGFRDRMSDPKWFWWLWMLLPAALAAVFYRQMIELFRRCRRGDEYAFDSTAGTVTHNGKLTVHFRDIRRVLVDTFTANDRNTYNSNVYTLRLLLAGGSKMDLACLYDEAPVALLADAVADLLGLRLEREYRTVWDREGIKSLGLTQRQLDSETESQDAARRLGGAPEDRPPGSGTAS